MKSKLDDLAKNKSEIIFDLDMTLGRLLIDWSDFGWKFRDYAREFDSEMINSHSKELASTPKLIFLLIKKHGKEAKNLVDEFWSDWEEKYYKGVKGNSDLVEWVKQRGDLNHFVWTSNRRKTALMAIESLRLDGFFKKIVSANEVSNFKPSGDGFRLIRDPDISLGRYLFIGDSTSDEGAAKEVGLDFINVSELRWN